MGPPSVPPNWFWSKSPRVGEKSIARIQIGVAQKLENIAVKWFVPDFVTTLIWPPLNSPYSASKLFVKMRNSAMESRLGMTAAPMLTSSSTSLPLTMKLLANSRWPLMEIVPGFKSPEGERTLAPTSCTVSEVIDVAGATPG